MSLFTVMTFRVAKIKYNSAVNGLVFTLKYIHARKIL